MAQQMPMINVGGSNLPPEIMQQQQALNRQQQMAQLLMQQGQQQPQGQMVSGRYVAPSFFQYVAPLAQLYAGKRLAEKGDEAMLDLAEQLRKGKEQETQAIMEQLRPRDVQTEMAGPYTGNVPMPVATQTLPPNFQAATNLALQSRYGAGKELLPTLINRALPEPIKPTTEMQNYEYAKSQGYKGTLNDFKNQITPYQQAQLGMEREKFEFEKSKAAIKPLPEGLNKQVTGAVNLTDAITDYQTKIKGFGFKDFANPDKRAEMGNLYNNMMLQAKEAYNLGVLNGPDYDILQKVVKDPTNVSSLAFSNTALSNQADSLRKTSSDIVKNAYLSQGREVPADIAAKFVKKEEPKTEQKGQPKATGAVARAMLNGKPIVVRDGKWVDERTGKAVE
jgi:hypothetical protein